MNPVTIEETMEYFTYNITYYIIQSPNPNFCLSSMALCAACLFRSVGMNMVNKNPKVNNPTIIMLAAKSPMVLNTQL